jgi:hypothetical protein
VCDCLREVCVPITRSEFVLLRESPCLPFYSFQGEGSGYICSKKMKWEKTKEKKVASGAAVFLLIRWEQFSW